MLRLLIVISSLFIGSFGVDVAFSFGSTCFSEDTSLELKAEYNGTGTVTAIQWYYSGKVSNNMLVLAGTCDTPGAVPAGYPDKSRMTFTCDLATNIFTLTLSGLQADELDKSWGATFTLSVGQSPDVEQKQISVCTNCKCVCDCECRTIVIVSMVFGILGALGLLIIVVGIPLGCFNERKTLLLTSGVIGINFDVLSLVLSIVVTVKECCECCEENCEDSECCGEDSECCKDWIDNAAITFIVIPCVAVIASAVIFVLVKSDVIRPGNDGCNAFNCFNGCNCFNGGNNGGNDGGNDGGNNGGRGHGGGHGPNSNTVHSERTDTHRVPTSDRRPMPPIPLTDKKGRGLSANYDDEHPMISVGIPDKKAGDLGPLEEESKKKKKKKKKTKNDGDEREKEENKE